MLGPILAKGGQQLGLFRRAQKSDSLVVFGLDLDQRGRIGREHMILDRLAKEQRKGVSVAVPRRWGPFPLIVLLKEPFLNILSRNPFGW